MFLFPWQHARIPQILDLVLSAASFIEFHIFITLPCMSFCNTLLHLAGVFTILSIPLDFHKNPLTEPISPLQHLLIDEGATSKVLPASTLDLYVAIKLPS